MDSHKDGSHYAGIHVFQMYSVLKWSLIQDYPNYIIHICSWIQFVQESIITVKEINV